MSRHIVFAIDYDGTWTRAENALRCFVGNAHRDGHTCVMVTGRSDDPNDPRWAREVRRDIGDLMPILFCAGKWKRTILDAWLVTQRMASAHCVWVDDSPEYVGPQDPRMTANR